MSLMNPNSIKLLLYQELDFLVGPNKVKIGLNCEGSIFDQLGALIECQVRTNLTSNYPKTRETMRLH
jgi:hypothetical protein